MQMVKDGIDKKITSFLYYSISDIYGWIKNGFYHTHRAANYWAELDLNQRRHIANEFTVRPH